MFSFVELVHFTSPSSGTVLTYERATGELLWQKQLNSPVVALYSVDYTHSSLISVPFTSIASETLNRLTTPAARDNSQLSPTLYIGQCAYGFYAVPSLVDETVLTISSGTFPYLIEGPAIDNNKPGPGKESQPASNLYAQENETSTDEVDKEDFILLGMFFKPLRLSRS